jgi:hypothetical protein
MQHPHNLSSILTHHHLLTTFNALRCHLARPQSSDGATASSSAASSGRWQLLSRTELAGGTLEVVAWEGERCLRIWLPPGKAAA